MKKALLFLIFLVIGGFAAKAQYVTVDGPLSYKWGGIYDANGHRLSRDEGNANYFLTLQQQRMFKRGRNQYLWGAGITLSAVASVSYYTLMDAGYVENTDEMNVFIGLATVMAWYSLPCLIAGPSLLLTGRHKMKDLTEDYNYARQNKGDVSLSFGPQQHGYGMAITF